MSDQAGKDVVVEYSIADEEEAYVDVVWTTLGMIRGKDISVAWETVDSTADDSPLATKRLRALYKTSEISLDGVSDTDSATNLSTLEGHILNPGTETNRQPKVWLRFTYVAQADKSFAAPYMITEYSVSSPYDDIITWSLSATSIGGLVRRFGA